MPFVAQFGSPLKEKDDINDTFDKNDGKYFTFNMSDEHIKENEISNDLGRTKK